MMPLVGPERGGVALVGAAAVIAFSSSSTVAQSISTQTMQAVVQVLYANPQGAAHRFGTAFHVGTGTFYTNAPTPTRMEGDGSLTTGLCPIT